MPYSNDEHLLDTVTRVHFQVLVKTIKLIETDIVITDCINITDIYYFYEEIDSNTATWKSRGKINRTRKYI